MLDPVTEKLPEREYSGESTKIKIKKRGEQVRGETEMKKVRSDGDSNYF